LSTALAASSRLIITMIIIYIFVLLELCFMVWLILLRYVFGGSIKAIAYPAQTG